MYCWVSFYRRFCIRRVKNGSSSHVGCVFSVSVNLTRCTDVLLLCSYSIYTDVTVVFATAHLVCIRHFPLYDIVTLHILSYRKLMKMFLYQDIWLHASKAGIAKVSF